MVPAWARLVKWKAPGSRHQVPSTRKAPSQSQGISMALSQRSRGRVRRRRRIVPVTGRRSGTAEGSLSRAMARIRGPPRRTVPRGSCGRAAPRRNGGLRALLPGGARLRLAFALALLVGIVRRDDLLHQRVADDVLLVEIEELDPLDPREHLLRLAQSRGPPLRQVDLGDVAVDHRLGVEADAGEDDLHLLRGG